MSTNLDLKIKGRWTRVRTNEPAPTLGDAVRYTLPCGHFHGILRALGKLVVECTECDVQVLARSTRSGS